MAGLWSTWRPKERRKDAPPLLSCTIITTDSAGPLADIHDRMPLTISAARLGPLARPRRPDRRGAAARPRRPGPHRDPGGVPAGEQRPQQRPGARSSRRASVAQPEQQRHAALTEASAPVRHRRRRPRGRSAGRRTTPTDGVAELLGADADAAFSRGLWWSALRATDRAAPDAAASGGAGAPVPARRRRAPRPRRRRSCPVPASTRWSPTASLETGPHGTLRAALDIRPHCDGARDFLVVSDQDAALRAATGAPRPRPRHRRRVGVAGARGRPHARAARPRPRHRLRDPGPAPGRALRRDRRHRHQRAGAAARRGHRTPQRHVMGSAVAAACSSRSPGSVST